MRAGVRDVPGESRDRHNGGRHLRGPLHLSDNRWNTRSARCACAAVFDTKDAPHAGAVVSCAGRAEERAGRAGHERRSHRQSKRFSSMWSGDTTAAYREVLPRQRWSTARHRHPRSEACEAHPAPACIRVLPERWWLRAGASVRTQRRARREPVALLLHRPSYFRGVLSALSFLPRGLIALRSCRSTEYPDLSRQSVVVVRNGYLTRASPKRDLQRGDALEEQITAW